MYKVPKSSIIKGRELVFENETTFKGYQKRYPLNDVESCSYKVKANRHDGFIILNFLIKGKLSVFDTRDNEIFVYPINIKEETEILDDEDGDREGYIVSGANLDLDDLTLLIIQSSLPLRLVRKENEAMPRGIPGVNILSDEEKNTEETSNFSLDGLPDFPSMNDK